MQLQLGPYINKHNSVAMSENGALPVYYEGYQQSDEIHIKALALLQELVGQPDPFFLMLTPTASHAENFTDPPTPPSRYLSKFDNKTLPYRPNFNPPDKLHQDRPSWWAGLRSLNSTREAEAQTLYPRRLEVLRGVDDIIEDANIPLVVRGPGVPKGAV